MDLTIWQQRIMSVVSWVITPNDDENIRLQKIIFMITSIGVGFLSIIWGLTYIMLNEPVAGAIPLSYSLVSSIQWIVLRRTRQFELYRNIQMVLIIFLPFGVMIALGGFANGSVVVLWSFLGAFIALVSSKPRQAIQWYLVYLVVLILCGFLSPNFRETNNLPPVAITLFFVLNIGAISSIAFGTLLYFVRQKELAMELIQKNRELERTNLQQEILLRQSEKLSTLGRLSAGVAHELNNPAAATQRGTAQLRDFLSQLEDARFQFGRLQLSDEQTTKLDKLINGLESREKSFAPLDPLDRSDKEYDIEQFLEKKGIENAWEYAPTLVDMYCGVEDLTEIAGFVTPAEFVTIIHDLSSRNAASSLLAEIEQGAGKITEIVQALKTYTYLDQAPVNFLDVHEGLENTLVMLRSKLNKGIKIYRDYAEDLPPVQAYGSELNQVWTNIIDNAIDAMNNSGEIRIRTRREEDCVVVEIQDNGPGIPPDVEPYIFDPFYTTKRVGEGTGLGLNISFNIITQKHKGEITVTSQPGNTCFQVRLPPTIEVDTELEAVGT